MSIMKFEPSALKEKNNINNIRYRYYMDKVYQTNDKI